MRNYLKFLDYLTDMLNRHFQEQAPFIKCCKGCAKCCSNGDYPFSEMEIKLLKIGFYELDDEKKQIIKNNIRQIITDKQNFTGENFRYTCPFLIDDVCSVYEYRGIICRTFGLISTKKDSKMQVPFCVHEGLNYSNVLDKNTGMLSEELLKEQGITVEPVAYNIHYSFLTSDKIEDAYDFKFGKKSALIDLLAEEKTFI